MPPFAGAGGDVCGQCEEDVHAGAAGSLCQDPPGGFCQGTINRRFKIYSFPLFYPILKCHPNSPDKLRNNFFGKFPLTSFCSKLK